MTQTSLMHLSLRTLERVCHYIGLPFKYRICSELSLDLPPQLGPGDWAREICTALGAESYLNPASGSTLFDPDTFESQGIELLFLQAETFIYKTGRFTFEPNLSILDVLMWNRPEAVLEAVHRYTLIPAVQNTACSLRSTLTSPATSRA